MSLREKIKFDSDKALKSGDQFLVDVLRLVLAAINSKEKEKRYNLFKNKKAELSEKELNNQSLLLDDEVINVLNSEIKKRKDAISLYRKGKRLELAEKEMKEIQILQRYLPTQFSFEELEKIVQESIKNTGASNIKDMGKVMADLIPKIKGKADNSEASKLIKKILNS